MTPAIELLRKRGIQHTTVSYEHDRSTESYGMEAVEALGLDPATVFKTLLATVDGTAHGTETVVAIVPADRRLNLKSLAKAAGGKKAAMADPTRAERLTGYVVGGISPLGQRKRLKTFIDESAGDLDEMLVSGGRRGLEIKLTPADLAAAVDASFRKLADDA